MEIANLEDKLIEDWVRYLSNTKYPLSWRFNEAYRRVKEMEDKHLFRVATLLKWFVAKYGPEKFEWKKQGF